MVRFVSSFLIYDVSSTPKGMTVHQVLERFKQEGIVLWDSGSAGVEPMLATLTGFDDGTVRFYKTRDDGSAETEV